MAFVVRALFLSALVYIAKAGVISHDHSHHDSYLTSAAAAPSASYGPPSATYGPPAPVHLEETHHSPAFEGNLIADHHIHHEHHDHHDHHGPALISSHHDNVEHISGPGLLGPSLSAPALHGPAFSGPTLHGPGLSGLAAPLHGPGFAGPALSGDSTLLLGGARQIGVATNVAVGPPRVIGQTVTVGRPQASASRYELQAVIQDVIRRVPVEITRHVQLAVPHPVPVPVRQEVKVPVPQPYPVHVDVVKHVPYPVYKTKHVEVERPVPVEVVRHVPFEVIRKVPIPVERPYEVIRKVHIPIDKHIEVPVPVWKPHPIHIIKHVTHYKKKHCCW